MLEFLIAVILLKNIFVPNTLMHMFHMSTLCICRSKAVIGADRPRAVGTIYAYIIEQEKLSKLLIDVILSKLFLAPNSFMHKFNMST